MNIPQYENLEKLKEQFKKNELSINSFIQKLKKKKPKKLDDVVHELHIEAFSKFDCLTCANCCKTISPIITDKDIERISHSMKIKAVDFIAKYLKIDEDQDYVFKSSPCPFLMHDNYCIIYENRPKACREYPHTDRARFYQILDLTFKNCEVCPVVYNIVNTLKTNEW